MGTVLWKPLYITSIFMFILSLILIPFSMKWSIIVVLALIAIWTRIPGFIHFTLGSFSMNDLLAFIIAATVGLPIGIAFYGFGLWGARLFGPDEWTPFTVRMTIAGFIALIFVPSIIKYFGGITAKGFLIYLIINYIIYYSLVYFFFKEEIGLEIILFPSVLFFNFALHLEVMKIFGRTISGMMTQGIGSGWLFIVFAGIILGLALLSKNANKLGNLWENLINKKEEQKPSHNKYGKYMFNQKELVFIVLMTLIISFVFSFPIYLEGLFFLIPMFFVIIINVFTKKITSYYLDSEIEINLWKIKRYSFKPEEHFEKPVSIGLFLPIVTAILSFGYFIWLNGLIFNVKTKVYRAAKKYGLYNFSEITEYHIALIAASGVFINLIFAVIGYLIGFETFSKLNIYYAFFNLLPISNLDGNKIFFGSLILWSFLAIITLIGLAYIFLVI